MFKNLFKRPKRKQVKLDIINALELKKDSTYILVADSTAVSRADMMTLTSKIRAAGIRNVVGFMLSGDPEESIQFVQRNTSTKRKKSHATK